jgi:nucleoside-diphosphate kinase
MIQHTLSIIKPEAIRAAAAGKVLTYLENAGLKMLAMKMINITTAQAQVFYAEHSQKGFFPGLINNITSGPVIVMVLEGEDAIALNRKIMGATDPSNAEKGTIRGDLGESLDANFVHGSDSQISAEREISIFFAKTEILKSHT